MKRVRGWIDPFVVLIVLALVLGLTVPVPTTVMVGVERVGDVAIFLLFLAYGMRLSPMSVLAGMRNWRLQGGILATTYVLFPLLGLLISWALGPLLGAGLATGLLYLSLLPSTVQSAVAFVSVARGNVAGAICAATISNVLGMVLTPALVLWLMGVTGTAGVDGLRSVLLQLLLPFVLGQLLQPALGSWLRARRWLTTTLDRGTVILLVFSAVVAATHEGVWDQVSPATLMSLLLGCAAILAAVLGATWWGGRALRLDPGDRIALLMCGSKKSLATGLPMALVIFPAATAATVAVPVIVFHQMQLIVCAALARRLARRQDAAGTG